MILAPPYACQFHFKQLVYIVAQSVWFVNLEGLLQFTAITRLTFSDQRKLPRWNILEHLGQKDKTCLLVHNNKKTLGVFLKYWISIKIVRTYIFMSSNLKHWPDIINGHLPCFVMFLSVCKWFGQTESPFCEQYFSQNLHLLFSFLTRDGLLLRTQAEDMLSQLQTNLVGTMLTCKAAVKSMIQQQGGAIVNLGMSA